MKRTLIASLVALSTLAALVPAHAFGPKDLPMPETSAGFGPKDLPEPAGPAFGPKDLADPVGPAFGPKDLADPVGPA